MAKLSHYQVLLSAYPGKIRTEDSHRVQVQTIRGCETPTDLDSFTERLATVISELDTEFYSYISEAKRRQQQAHQQQDVDKEAEDPSSSDIPEEFRRFEEQSQDTISGATTVKEPTEETHSYDFSIGDIELAELGDTSKVVSVPFPRVYRCTDPSCGHFSIVKPDKMKQSINCPDVPSHRLRRFPYLFVCPRCAHIEQASPHQWLQKSLDEPEPGIVIDKNDTRDKIACPETDCNGHLHVELGDRIAGVRFYCSSRSDHSGQFYGQCPTCHMPGIDGEDEILSEMRPKTIDSRHTEPLILEDLVSDHGTRINALYEASRDNEESDETYHWNLDTITTGSKEIFEDTFSLNDVFTVSGVSSVTGVYGYESSVESRGTDLDEQGRIARTFDSGKSDYERRVYLTRRDGRAIVFDLNDNILEGVVSNGEAEYSTIASRELEQLNELDAEEIAGGDAGLQLIPLLHAYQHALYQAAIEESGLEDFLAAKVLVEAGAIVLVEQRDVGAGGLSQITMNKTGNVLLRTMQRAEEILTDCSRDCNEACLSCVFTEDARCHPFVSREVDGYVPANSLLNRHLAAEVIRRA
jgi:hypothetical protein